MKNVRVFYNKTGRLKYVSHLDMNRVFMRFVRRAGIPIWYTEGFNPHPKINFALPLSLGFESECESVDIRLEDDNYPCDEVAKKLSAVMPEGLSVTGAADPVMKVGDIAYARFEITAEFPEKTDEFFGRDSIIAEKKAKKKKGARRNAPAETKTVDIKPLIKEWSLNGNVLTLVLCAGNDNLNPTLVLESLSAFCGEEINPSQIVRKAMYNSSMELFR